MLTQYREVTTNLVVETGWNYVAIYLDEIYEFSYVTMYNRYTAMTQQTNADLPAFGQMHRKYETFFAGEYDENSLDYGSATVAFPNPNLVIVIGCSIYAEFDLV